MLLITSACSSVLPTALDPPRDEPSEVAGPQAVAATDWELLGQAVGVAEPATIEVALDDEALAELWNARFPDGPIPSTAIVDPVYVLFNLLVQSSCPDATIDAIQADRAARLVFGQFTRQPGRANCGDIAGDHTFVVAISRAALPEGHVTFRLERDFSLCIDCGRELEQVGVDL